ncbi:MAG: DUF1905 domain-containing protein [Bacteroidetes bacterium]|nr:DUF1905 domain-containing protein [Bacteroidota bacterium]
MKPISFKTHIDKLSYLKTFYLEVPAPIVKKIGGIGKVRLLCEVNKQLKFQCGLVSLPEGKAYISINSKRMKELGVVDGDTVDVILTEDRSEYGVEVPEELTELFKQDPEGKRRFDVLKPGMQRYILNHVNTVKNPQLRVDRAFMLITNLKNLTPGKETFREILGK